jgi:threonine dehydrogenase-like Zn-dependent dehydrogenase
MMLGIDPIAVSDRNAERRQHARETAVADAVYRHRGRTARSRRLVAELHEIMRDPSPDGQAVDALALATQVHAALGSGALAKRVADAVAAAAHRPGAPDVVLLDDMEAPS